MNAARAAGDARKQTLQYGRILQVLLEDPGRPLCHLELTELTGLPAATVHAALGRLAGSGWLASRWEGGRQGGGGKRRRMYSLTPVGLASGPAVVAAAGTADLEPGLGWAAARVSRIFLAEPGQPHHWGELTARTGLSGAAIRQVLARMVAADWLAAALEVPATRPGATRPRRLFTLTPTGLTAVRRSLAATQAWLDIARPVPGAPEPEP